MPRLPVVAFRDVDRALARLGFAAVRQKGSQLFYLHSDGRTTTVPHHGYRAKRFARIGRETVSVGAIVQFFHRINPDHAHAVVALPTRARANAAPIVATGGWRWPRFCCSTTSAG